MEQSFYNFVYRTLEICEISLDFFYYIERNYKLIVFGGSVRDYLYFEERYQVRDFDFVIAGLENKKMLISLIKKYFKNLKYSVNQFDGFKIITENITLDCWRLDDTYAFCRGKAEKGVEQLLNTTMLNIDCYAYDMSERQYVSKCNENVFPHVIDFNLYIEELLEINLVRALIYSRKYNLRLSTQIKEKLRVVMHDEIRKEKMMNFLDTHYDKEIINWNEVKNKILEE